MIQPAKKKWAKKKWFVSCIIPGVRQVGMMQFEANDSDMQATAEELAPCRCAFKAYELEEWEPILPIGEFVDCEKAKELGY